MERTVEDTQHNAELTVIVDKVAQPNMDMEEIGTLVADYIAGDAVASGESAPRAIWLTVALAKQIKQMVFSEMPSERLENRKFKVQLVGMQYNAESNELLSDDIPEERRIKVSMDFALHVCEHLCNDEYELFYNHLLELSVDVDQYIHLINGMIFVYNRMCAVGDTNGGRMTSLIIDENGVETVRDRGNTDLSH